MKARLGMPLLCEHCMAAMHVHRREDRDRVVCLTTHCKVYGVVYYAPEFILKPVKPQGAARGKS